MTPGDCSLGSIRSQDERKPDVCVISQPAGLSRTARLRRVRPGDPRPGRYADYRLDGQSSIRRFGGRVLSGDPAPEGVVELLEGEWPTKRLVITEFPTIDVARAWYRSDLYQAAARKRQATSSGRVLLVGGWDRPW
jgi:uncharacterized protein (DUF1330 family)